MCKFMLANLNWEGTNMTYDALQLQVPPTGTDTFLFPVVKQELKRELIYLYRLAGIAIHG